jgi:hypothetical protein
VALGLLLASSAGHAEEGAPYELGTVRKSLRLVHDGKGHYLAVVPLSYCQKGPDKSAQVEAVFYGDGKVFYHLRARGGGADCSKGRESFEVYFWEPRVSRPAQAYLEQRGGRFVVRCGERKTELTLVPEAEGRALIAKARFLKARWTRLPYALARDERGTYYFVDILRGPPPARDFRLYVGPRGNLKLQRMKNVVSDSEGDIFSTLRGELRLVLGRGDAAWIRGKKRTKLLLVPVERNVPFIYSELGPYVGERLGTPCDDL